MTTARTPTRREDDALNRLQSVEIGNDILRRQRAERPRERVALMFVPPPSAAEEAAALRTLSAVCDRAGHDAAAQEELLEALGFIPTIPARKPRAPRRRAAAQQADMRRTA